MADKINIDNLLDKIASIYQIGDKNPFKDEVELQADNLKNLISKKINKDKKEAQKKFTEDQKKNIKDRKYKKLADAYNNPLTLSGASNLIENSAGLTYNNLTLNWWLSIAMYDNSGIFKIAVDTLSQDLIRAGVTPNISNVIKKKHIQKLFNSLKPELITALKNTQLFGGAIGVIMFDTINDYSVAPDLELIKKAKKIVIRVFDRWQISVDKNLVKEFTSDDYMLPRYYSIISNDERLNKVHHGYVMRFILREPPKIVKDLLSGWGYSQLSHIYTELMKDQQLKNNIVSLTNKALLEVVQMSGMKGLFSALADPESQQEIEARLEMVNRYRNNNSLIFLDKEDSYNQFTFGGLSGLADLMESNKDDVCAILEMSKMLLFGDSKGGLSGNSDSEYQWYQGKINGKQEEYLRRPLTKLLKYLYLMSQADEEDMISFDFAFNSIIPEKSEQKAERFKSFIEGLIKLKEVGIYDDEDVKKEIIAHADEYDVGIAPYKLKTIFQLKEEQKKEKFKIKPVVKVETYKIIPDTIIKTELVEQEQTTEQEPELKEEPKENVPEL